ncbi:A24 family peptidase [Alicyclobacillus sp. SO9]|uniref:prepilin peptidase n=1 Tax=Alicyclobacillus sp. SO9 TaxID=2665646 RepID=UPI0018E77B98|nr:A24 family peptidase [Alicyclobacillus sp. SO9]QQE77011.1 prepilin peptidase [Alicyclobacillus sp. SO9]
MLTLVSLLVFAYGSVFASFGSVVASRLPQKQSIVSPRSYCPNCKRSLNFFELIPIVSWLGLRGKCRSCSTPISIRHPAFELLGGCLWVATYLYVPGWPQRAVFAVFWLFLLVLVETDILYMKVPNVLTYPGVLIFFILTVLTGIQSVKMALIGFVVNFGLLFFLSIGTRGKMGMGDAKLYGVIGVVLGPWAGLLSLVVAAFSGSVVGLTLRAFKLLKKRQYVPFVPHIAIGVIVSVFFGSQLLNWYIQLVLYRGY